MVCCSNKRISAAQIRTNAFCVCRQGTFTDAQPGKQVTELLSEKMYKIKNNTL
ncbi:MAG: hypothetical protein ACEY3G_03570 [Arsenophonus sp.]